MAMRDWDGNGSKDDLFDNMMDYKLYQEWKKAKNIDDGTEDLSEINFSDRGGSSGSFGNSGVSKKERRIFNIVGSIIILTVVYVICYIINWYKALDYDIQSTICFNIFFIPLSVSIVCFIVYACTKPGKLRVYLSLILSVMTIVSVFLCSLYRIDVFTNWNVEHLQSMKSYFRKNGEREIPDRNDVWVNFYKYEVVSGNIKDEGSSKDISYYVVNNKFDQLTPEEMGKFFYEADLCVAQKDFDYLKHLWKEDDNKYYIPYGYTQSNYNYFTFLGVKCNDDVYMGVRGYHRCIVYKNSEPLYCYDNYKNKAITRGTPLEEL